MDYEVVKINPLKVKDDISNLIEYVESVKGVPSESDKYDMFLITTNKYRYKVKIYYDKLWSDKIGYRHVYKINLDKIFNELGFNTSKYYASDSKGGIIQGGYKDNCNEYLQVFNQF